MATSQLAMWAASVTFFLMCQTCWAQQGYVFSRSTCAVDGKFSLKREKFSRFCSIREIFYPLTITIWTSAWRVHSV